MCRWLEYGNFVELGRFNRHKRLPKKIPAVSGFVLEWWAVGNRSCVAYHALWALPPASMHSWRLFGASCASPYGRPSAVQNCSRQFCRTEAFSSTTTYNTNKKTANRRFLLFEWWGVRDYSYHHDTHPCGASLRLFKIVPDDFGERGAFDRHTQSTQTKKPPEGGFFCLNGGACAIRTRDHLIKSQMLYQLS